MYFERHSKIIDDKSTCVKFFYPFIKKLEKEIDVQMILVF